MKQLITYALLGLLPATAALAAESVAAPEKAAICSACHGPNGAKPIAPTYPVLAGQYDNYLERALHDYKSGARKNPIMGAQAAGLSDAEIKALANYFSLQDSPLYTPTVHSGTK
ncbi:Cytochrome c553 [Solimonas aquatica]|uniref:Cytochrome c553 n=1 Tax=Solimonas aquatica TaxID=489703 RepID=A0A1H9EUN4_9GAMM|nr:cytochrome c [Solimonas aquatica]SEQ29381.1 Cytochrome c553 [Solimonas aquatica]